jgi:hypothetical protein
MKAERNIFVCINAKFFCLDFTSCICESKDIAHGIMAPFKSSYGQLYEMGTSIKSMGGKI